MTNALARQRILVVDDEPALLASLCDALEEMGYETAGESSGASALERARSWQPDALLTDLRLPGMDGVELAQRAMELFPELPVVVLTGFGTVRNAVEALHKGIYDYLPKPFDLDEVDLTLKKALAHASLKRQALGLATALSRAADTEGIVGDSPAVRQALDSIATVAQTGSTVLLTGESGTGKELAARAIHNAGPRRDLPIITVDCASIPSSLIESELFGHARGAFTGAHADRTGYFEVASSGTVFLDEIGELELSLQKKFLRVLEDRTFTRIGESRRRATEARVVAATNRDLKAEVAAGRFREDLYYRLKVVEIRLPPLREHPQDLPELCRHYLPRLCRKLNREVRGVSPAAMKALMAYSWPGNVREFVNLLEQALTFHNPGVLEEKHLPEHLRAPRGQELPSLTFAQLKDKALEKATREYLESLLSHYRGNITRVAAHADTDRRHMHRLLRKFALDPESFRDG